MTFSLEKLGIIKFSLEKLGIIKFPIEELGIAKFPLVKGVRGIFECQKSYRIPCQSVANYVLNRRLG